MRYPLLGKAAALGAVTLALVAALSTVSGIVREREGRLREAEQSVMDSLASKQTLVGPVLQRQCEESWEALQEAEPTASVVNGGIAAPVRKEPRVVRMQRELNVTALPVKLGVQATAVQEARYRGLFKVNGYTLKAQVNAGWKPEDLQMPLASMPKGVVKCKPPVLWVEVSDARGLRKAALRLNGAEAQVLPGTLQGAHPRGFHAVLPEGSYGDGPSAPAARALNAVLDIDLVGTTQLALAPVADDNHVALTSNWPHPSFAGRFLPVQRDVTEKGFSAEWQVSALASAAQQQLKAGGVACSLDGLPMVAGAGSSPGDCIESFGVHFIDPVNGYVLSDRATKYGLLFIALTFVGVGLVEVQRRLRVHPIQYLLVGCALALFFLMLVSLGEHLAFTWAYAAASTACTLLLTFYGCFVLRGWRAGLVFGGAIGLLYGALFLLLRMEQSALVLGSALLFAVLAAVMFTTRRMDWYAFTADVRKQEQRAQ